jgi:hypothetical protein
MDKRENETIHRPFPSFPPDTTPDYVGLADKPHGESMKRLRAGGQLNLGAMRSISAGAAVFTTLDKKLRQI